MSRARRAITIISLIILIMALVFVAYKLFQLRKISVNGCESIEESDVIAQSGLEIDQSIFLIDKEKVMAAIDVDPLIKPIQIEITYPDQVTIHVEERKEAAYVNKDGAMLAIDKECFLLRVAEQDSAAVPLVFGLKMDKFDVGKRLGVGDTFQLDVLERVLTQMTLSHIGIYSVDVAWPANVVLQTSDGLTVEIGDDTQLSEKFALAQAAVEELNQLGKTGGILDVSSVTSAYYRDSSTTDLLSDKP